MEYLRLSPVMILSPVCSPKENDNLKMELTWTIVPFILIVYLTYIAWGPLDEMWSADPDAHEIGVTANQWFWDFDCMSDDEDDNATLGQQNVAYNAEGEVICEISTIDVEGGTNDRCSGSKRINLMRSS